MFGLLREKTNENTFDFVNTWLGNNLNINISLLAIYFLLLSFFFLFFSGLNLKTGSNRAIFLILASQLLVIFITQNLIVFLVFFEGLTAALAFMIWTSGASERKY